MFRKNGGIMEKTMDKLEGNPKDFPIFSAADDLYFMPSS